MPALRGRGSTDRVVLVRRFKHTHPLEVLAYAVKHGHLDIVDEVAPVAIGLPPQDVVKILPQYLVIPWVMSNRSRVAYSVLI